MKTFILEGIVTAVTSICHNGGERNGVVTQLRREKFVQKNGRAIEIPVVSGNSIRGKLRDIAAMEILTKEDGEKVKVDADSFNLLFSGGSLESTGGSGIDTEKVRKMREDMPMLSVLGCSVGNVILPGKVDIGKLIPICKETEHLIPEKFHGADPLKSIWEYCQVEMNTRTDDAKNENYRHYMTNEAKDGEKIKSQMMYHTETIAAGTRFYWKVCLRDTTDVETGAFIKTLQSWAEMASQVGGNGRVGHGAIKLQIAETKVIDSELEFDNPEFVKYVDRYKEKKKDVSEYFEKGVSKTLFSDEKK
jgi:CRISPR/Cas system CSM-associated protein Csm3 (group 7 of RAMP superfamily)